MQNHPNSAPLIQVRSVAGKGRGIIAIGNIAAGSLIETAPAVEFPADERSTVDATSLFAHYFVDPQDYNSGPRARGYIVFGLSSLCNHAAGANARVEWHRDPVGLWAYLIASKNIQIGEEVTVFYTNIDEYSDSENYL